MQTHILRSVVLASSLVLLAGIGLSLLLPELHGNWSQTLTITGTVETGNFTPSGLECEEDEKDRVLSWKPGTGADSYILYHRGPRANDYHEFTEVDATDTTYEDLRPSYFRHRWYVTSTINKWESEPSNSIRVHCRPDTSTSGPKKLQGENHHSQRTVELTWEATPGAILYGIVRADEQDGTYELLDTTTDNSYMDTSVADGITYYYLVVAVDDEGIESDPSEVVAVLDELTTPTDELAPTPGDQDATVATPTPAPSPADGCDSGCGPVVKLGNMTVMMGGMGTVRLEALNIPEPGLGAWTIEIIYDRDVVVVEDCAAHEGSCVFVFATGNIRIVGTGAGKTGDTNLGSLSFSCKALGASGLAINVHVLQDAAAGGGQQIAADTQDGGVTCVAPAGSAPEPTATETPSPHQTPTPTPTTTPTPAGAPAPDGE